MATATKTAGDEWMLKDDAAKFLGVQPRSVEKRARAGQIEFQYLPRLPKEKQARVVYKRASLEAILKGETITEVPRHPVTKRPLGETLPHASAALVLAKSAESQADSWAALTRTLAKIGERLEAPAPPAVAEGLAAMQLTPQAQLAALNAQTALCEAQIAALKIPMPRKEWPAWLTFDEAVQYSGLTPAMLQNVIRDGSVASLGRGRGTWRISRASLDEYGKAGA